MASAAAGLSQFVRASRANRLLRGLYHGKTIRYGKQVSHSERKTSRRWEPNTVWAEFYSEILEEKIKLRTAPGVMRTIDKYMGFDNYIIMAEPRYLEGLGMQLKHRMLDKMRERPELTAEDCLNVSPECWDYLKKWDQKFADEAALKEKAASESETEKIEEEKLMANYRKELQEAIVEGNDLPQRPEPKKKKKISVKKLFIQKRIAKKEAVERRRKNIASVVHGKYADDE
eukprot:jgi/Bigna1/54037/estExt_Genewise1Plus.C_280013